MDAERSSDETWPSHWLPREVVRTSQVRPIGKIPYHWLTVSMQDRATIEQLVQLGYRHCRTLSASHDPRLNRRAVFRRMIDDGLGGGGDDV